MGRILNWSIQLQLESAVILGVVVLVGLVGLCTMFVHFEEGWTWVDAAYFAITSTTTVSYGDLIPKHEATKIFLIFYLPVGIGVANEASLRIWTPEASPGEPIASRPSDWQTAPMPLAPVGTERLDPTPAARYFHALAYDSHADRVILFGGFLGYWFNDTWA